METQLYNKTWAPPRVTVTLKVLIRKTVGSCENSDKLKYYSKFYLHDSRIVTWTRNPQENLTLICYSYEALEKFLFKTFSCIAAYIVNFFIENTVQPF